MRYLFAVTTAASCGAVNAMHDSLTALGGMVPMWLMQTRSHLRRCWFLVLWHDLVCLLSCFIFGLMVVEHLNISAKIRCSRNEWVVVAILISPAITKLQHLPSLAK